MQWGQAVLQTMEETVQLMRNATKTAVECSFMAPGYGPWRSVKPANTQPVNTIAIGRLTLD